MTDVENRIIQVNPAFTAISGYRPQEVLGKDPRILGAGRHPAEFFESMWGALASDGRWAGEVWNKRPDGTVYVAWLAISTIRNDALESGGRHLATFTDITQRKEMEELLRHKAHSDPLTNLPNRALFYDRLQMAQTQARRYDENFALLYLDLDYFKNVNDSLGHAAGDELLIEAARRLVLAVRDADTVARLGGDEFAVILPKVSMQGEVERGCAAHRGWRWRASSAWLPVRSESLPVSGLHFTRCMVKILIFSSSAPIRRFMRSSRLAGMLIRFITRR